MVEHRVMLASVDFFITRFTIQHLGSFWILSSRLQYTLDIDLLLYKIINNQVYTLLNFVLCFRGISYISYLRNSRMYVYTSVFEIITNFLKAFFLLQWDRHIGKNVTRYAVLTIIPYAMPCAELRGIPAPVPTTMLF